MPDPSEVPPADKKAGRKWGAGEVILAVIAVLVLWACINNSGSSSYYDCPDRIYGAHPYADGC